MPPSLDAPLHEAITVLRRHRDDNQPAYDEAYVHIVNALKAVATRECRTFEKELGDFVEEIVAQALHGTPRRDGGYKEGYLQVLEHGEPIDHPKQHFLQRLRWSLIDAARRQRRTTAEPGRYDDGDGEVEVEGAVRVDVDVLALPRDVVRTLDDAVRVARVYMELALQGAGPSVQEKRAELRALLRPWCVLADAIRADVGRCANGQQRTSWREPGAAPDRWGRAWQHEYFTHEGATHFVHADEKPAHQHEPSGASLFYQHLRRMRKAYDEASIHTQGVVQAGVDRRPGTPRRVPVEWEPATHPTLQRNASQVGEA
jgi:hypothetical protein